MSDLPKKETLWRHRVSEKTYKVIELTNTASTRQDYPITVVYKDQEGNIWSRPLSKWHSSFIFMGF